MKSRSANPLVGSTPNLPGDPRLGRRGLLTGIAGLGAWAACEGPPPSTACGPGVDLQKHGLSGIDNFIVLMMENRSFDHLLGGLALDRSYPGRRLIDGLRGDESNPDRAGRPVPITRRNAEVAAIDLRPKWHISHEAWNQGRNDGFVTANPAHLANDVMSYHDREWAPLHYALADRYAVCDRWFASVMGSTWPNRFFLQAATSDGHTGNAPMLGRGPRTVWDLMSQRCLDARCYFAGEISLYTLAFPSRVLSGRGAMVPQRIDSFFRDAREGALPAFSLIEPDYALSDMHPPRKLALGEAFVASVVRAVEQSPQWSRTLLVITYDEHGGFYDHVAPGSVADMRPAFRQLGFRVPTILVGPSVAPGSVVSTPFEHVSVLATLRSRFGIESLGSRMDGAADLSWALDPGQMGKPALPRMPGMDPITLHSRDLRDPGGLEGGHEDIEQLLQAGGIPEEHRDRRDIKDRMAAWLRPAQEFGAVRVIR